VGSIDALMTTEPVRAEGGIRQALREGKVTSYELTARTKDGRETLVSYNATMFNDREGKQMCRIVGMQRRGLIGTPFAGYFADADQAAAGGR
jgi:hypothetical protein